MIYPYLSKIHEEEKQGILDVRILLNNDTEIDTEIQLSELAAWADRSVFYLSKMYVNQIKKGEKYDVFKKCVSISILDFTLFKEDKNFYSCFHIMEDTRHIKYTDKIEFHVIELPKLPVELKENNDAILLWAKFINAEKEEEFDMIAAKNPYIQSAYEHLQLISQDEEKRLEYEAREKAIRDYNQGMYEAKRDGRNEGIEIGREQGIQMGKEQSLCEVAKALLRMGQSIEFVVQATGMTIEQVRKIKEE